MAVYFFDTSSLVKRYFQEDGTAWIREITNPVLPQEIYIVRITGPEIIAAFFLKARTREISRDEAIRASEKFREDLHRQYVIMEVTESIADRAMSLIQQHGLRGYNAVQLAAASELYDLRRNIGLESPTFICADDSLNVAAESEGLSVEIPNTRL